MAKKVKDKRKSRKEKVKQIKDLSIPIPIEQLGGENDPCFGKLHDPRASECKRCGDSEICSIAMGQVNNMKRLLLEKKQNFKDLEELNIKPKVDKKVLRKSIKNRIREIVKMGGNKGIEIPQIIEDVWASYGKDGFSKKRIRKIMDVVVENSERIILTKNKLTWKPIK